MHTDKDEPVGWLSHQGALRALHRPAPAQGVSA